MAGSFRIAEGYVEVTADESGYDRAMDRLRAKKNLSTVRVNLDDKDAKARLSALVKPRQIKITTSLDGAATTTSLRNLTKDRKVKLTAELDDKAATTGLTRLTRDRIVKLTAELDDSAVSAKLAMLSGQQAVDILPKISDAAYNRVRKQLDRLTQERVVTIRATAETRVAADELRNLTQRRRVRIGADVDTRVAADDLANLTRRRTVRVVADADTAAAATRLAALTRPRSVHIGVDSGGGAASAGLLASGFVRMAAAALAALPTIVSLGSSIAQMGPAAAVAVPALGGLATVMATLAVGMSGVGAAFQAAGSKSGQSGATAASAARAVAAAQLAVARSARALKEAQQDAARQIQDAQKQVKEAAEDVRDAEVKAAADRKAALRRVADAERDLTDAVKDAAQAQEDLNAARKEATEQLEDLNNRLVDAQLDQRQAVLDVQDAEKELAAVKAKGAAATAQELEEAQLAYDRATQQLKEQQTETARLQEETTSANRAGVEGSDTVKAAQEKVADAQRTVGDRTREVRDAQAEAAKVAKDGAESVRDAQQKLADAQQGVADAQVAASRQVRSAQEALADAQRSVNSAQSQGAATTNQYADAMAKLSPNARDFVTSVRAMGPAFSALKMDVQDRLFRGLGDSVTRLGQAALPALRVGLGGMADNLNAMGRDLMGTFTRLADQGLLTRMFQGFNEGFAPLVKIPGQLGQAFVQLSIAASPAFKRITTAMAGESDKISKKLTEAFESGRLEAAIDHGIEVAKRFGRLVADAFGTLRNVLGAAAAGGGDALSVLGDAFAELRRVTGLPEMQASLTRIFGGFQSIASLVTSVVGAALSGLVPMVAPLVEAVGGIAAVLKGPLTAFFQFVADHHVIFGALATAVLGIAAGMKLWALGTAAVTAAQAVLAAVMAASPFTLVALAVVGLAAAFAYAWHESETFRGVVTGVWESVKSFFAGTWDWINTWIVEPFRKLYDVLVGHSIIPDLVHAIVGWFTQLWTDTKKIFTALKNWVVGLWNDLWKTLSSRWTSFYNGLRSAMTGAWKSVRDSFTVLKNSITNTWNALWNGVNSKITGIFSTINGKITSFRNGMKSAFSALRDSLGTIWSGVKSKIGAPIKWVIDHVYNNGLRKMWNSIAGKISSSITLPAISLGFNKGGVVPGSGSSDTVPAMLTPGERILSNEQVTQLGGHRGIDAMLGKDHPTKTGGNPSRQEERTRYQGGTQHYASGGIIGKVTSGIGGAISGAYDWAQDVVVGGLKKAAQAAINSLVRPLINQIPGNGVGSLLKGLANKAVDGMLGWFGTEDKKATGGPAVQRALSWVKTQNGLPYQWAGNGNPSWDCSGLMSAIESVIRGQKPHRRWATGSFSGNNGPAGWVRNLNSPFMVGITNSGVGHTAGTLAGMNVESSGGAGVHMGKSARGYNDSMFTSRWGFAPAAKYDSGGLLQPGATMAINATRKPEAVLTAEEHDAFRSIVTGLGKAGVGDGVTVNVSVEVRSMTIPTPTEAQRFAKAIADPVKEELRKLENSRRR
jgi:phage-related protein